MATAKGTIKPQDKKPDDLPEDKKVIDLGEVPSAIETTDGKSHDQVEKGVKLENKAAEYPAVVKLPYPTGRSKNPSPEISEYDKTRSERKEKLRKLRAEFEAAESDLAAEAEDPKNIRAERVDSSDK